MRIPRAHALFFIFLFVFLSGCVGLRLATRAREHQVNLEKGYRFERNGWIYVHIEGRPYERGYQHGHLVAPELKEIQRMMRHTVFLNTGMEWEFFIREAEKQFARKLDGEFLEEIKGIADGARAAGTPISWQEVLAWNGSADLLGYWWPKQDKGQYIKPDREHCSAFLATGTTCTQQGRVVMAHNSWVGFPDGQYYNVILDIKPAKGHGILMQAAPGLIHSGTDFAVTDAGLAITETTISGYNQYDPAGTPEFQRIRKAMQYADGLDPFVEIMLKDNNGGYANSWLLADVRTGEIMRFELGLKLHSVERTRAGWFIGSNWASDPRIRHMEAQSFNSEDIRQSAGARRVRLAELMEQYRGRLDVRAGQAILADHYDVYLKQENAGSRSIDGHSELDPLLVGNPFGTPFNPSGSVDGKVIDSELARKMSFWARWGCSCGRPFEARAFLKEHPQWSQLDGYLKDRPAQPWTLFKAGDRPTP